MPISTQDSKPFNKDRKDKKKKQQKNNRDSTTPAIGINMAEFDDKKQKKKDVNKTIYYNCDKKRQYTTKYPKS